MLHYVNTFEQWISQYNILYLGLPGNVGEDRILPTVQVRRLVVSLICK